MDFANLENMDKSEFLPLGTVKQEMLDPANGIDDGTANENNEINSATANNVPDVAETNNPVCDSAEKQVRMIRVTKYYRAVFLNMKRLHTTGFRMKETFSLFLQHAKVRSFCCEQFSTICIKQIATMFAT